MAVKCPKCGHSLSGKQAAPIPKDNDKLGKGPKKPAIPPGFNMAWGKIEARNKKGA